MNIHLQNGVLNFLLSLPNLKAWHRASSLILSPGSPVSALVDSSGNDFDLAQTDPGRRPVFATINGKPAVQYSGSQWLTNAAFILPQPCTVYAIISGTGVSGGRIVNGTPHGDSPGGPNLDMRPGGNGYNLWAGSMLSVALPPQNQMHVVAATFDAAESKVYLDGQFMPGDGTFAGTNGFNGLGLGGNGVNDYFNGAIYETLIFAGAHKPDDIAIAAKFLALANGA